MRSPDTREAAQPKTKKVKVSTRKPPAPYALPAPPRKDPYQEQMREVRRRQKRLEAFLKAKGTTLAPDDYEAYENMRHSYESAATKAQSLAGPNVRFAGKPTPEYVAKYGVGWGDVRTDPGGGYVVYADGPKDYRRAKTTAIRSARAQANQPRLEPLSEDQSRKLDEEQRQRASLTPAQRRAREMELAVDAWLASGDEGAQAVRKSAEATRLSPFARHYVFGDALSTPGFDTSNPWEYFDAAMLGTMVVSAAPGMIGRAAVQPIKATRAAGAGLWAARGGRAAAKTAAELTLTERALINRGVRAAFRPVGRGAAAVSGRIRPVASARAAHLATKKAAAREYFNNRATFLNLAAWDKRRLQLMMDEAGQAKIETMMAPVTGGARPLQARAGLERQLGFSGEPAARSAMGRGFENFIDSHRDLLSQLSRGVVRDTEAEAGKRVGRQLAFRRQFVMRPAIELRTAQARLKGAVDYTALRMVGENTFPADRIAYHVEQAALNPKNQLFHEVQGSLVSDAAKWITQGADGSVTLAENAPKRLHNMLRVLRGSSEAREAILLQLGLLSDNVIEGRINAPGAVIKGAKWMENEVAAQHKLLTSPNRAALREFIIGAGIPEGQVDAFFRAVADPAARSHVGLVRAGLEKEMRKELDEPLLDPARIASIRKVIANVDDEIDRHYQKFEELFYGQPGDHPGILLNDMMDAMGLPEHVDADGIAREILDSGLKLPEHLRDPAVLAQRINQAYSYVKSGEFLGGKDWYDRAAANIERVTGYINEHPRIQRGKVAPVTEKQVAQIFAILSAQDNTVNNVTQVRKALLGWVEHGEVWAGRNPSMRSQEVEKVLKGQNWDGRKRNSFYMNIIEDIDPEEYAALMAERGQTLEGDPVTVDMWIARIFGEKQPGSNYDAYERIFHRLAQETGWRPKEVQAAAWTGIKDAGIEAMRTKAVSEGKKIPPAYYLLKKAGAADAFEYGISRSFGQLQLEGLMVSPRADKALSRVMGPSAGATLRRSLVNVDKKTGYWVAHGAYETKIPTRKMNAAAIEGYKDAHFSVLGEKDNYFGIYRDDEDGFTYLDVSRWFRNRDEALAYSREQGQNSIADIKAINAKDWDNAFPESGLTREQADEIKVGLRKGPESTIPHAERVPEDLAMLEAKRAEREWDDLIQRVIRQQGWRNNQLSREAAHDWLHENPTAFPGWEDVRARVQTTREATYPEWAQFEKGDKDLVLGFLQPKESGKFILGLAPHAADIATVTHEWGHFLRFTNFRPYDLQKLSKWAGVNLSDPPLFETREEFLKWAASDAGKKWVAAEEKIARGFEVYVLTGGGKGLKEADRNALEVLARHIEENYAVRGPNAKEAVFQIAGLEKNYDELPGPIRDVYDFFLTHEELKGGQFRFQEGMERSAPGQFYVPYKRGLPVSVRHPLRTARSYIGFRRSLPEGRGALGAGTMDPNLTHTFKADLMRSGKFDNSQIASASAQGLQKAANLQSIYETRRALLARDVDGNYVLARVRPERSDDIAVKLNPRKNSGDELRKIHEYLSQMEKGEKVSIRDLQQQDQAVFERLSAETFGGKVSGSGLHPKGTQLGDLNGRPARDVAQDIIDGVMEPVDNIVWVPRRFLDQLGIFEAPRNIRSDNAVTRGAGITWDVVNDYLKSTLLYLNPHYYGMNIVGNAVMNLLHEGVFAPLNMSRAFWLSHQMGEETAFIDFLMGRGLMSVAELRSLGDVASGRKISGALGHLSGALVDMIPRRMAFIHEARRAGYRNADAIAELLNDPDALYHVVTKAKRAMVDFDELSPFERDVMTRYIFVYPWLKGATMWSIRFPKEHPIQTAALAWAYEKQQSLADEKVGPRPSYLDLVLPIGTAERYGDKYPLVWNMRQVFTFSTPFEIIKNIDAFRSGNPNGEALSEMLQPWYGNALVAVTGWDPFRHQEVPRGLPTLIKSLDPRLSPGVQAIQRVMRTEEERQEAAEAGRLYPRNRLDDILQLGLGSVAWTPVNPETARERSQIGPKSPEQKLDDWMKGVKELTGQDADPQMASIQANKLRYDEVVGDLERDHTDYDLTKARLQVFVELNPEQKANQEEWSAQIDATDSKNLKKWNAWLEKQLGWDQFAKYNAYLNKWKKYQEGLSGAKP